MGRKPVLLGRQSPLCGTYRGKTGIRMHNLSRKSDTKGCRRTKQISRRKQIMTRNSKNEYSKNEYSKNGYEKSEYSKNQKNSRDCNRVKDREMSSYDQQNREQDEEKKSEKY